jgi:hypothetical protein
MPHPQTKVHRMSELIEPIATVTFSDVTNEAFLAIGMRNFWVGYGAGRAAPLGLAPDPLALSPGGEQMFECRVWWRHGC